MSLERLRIIQGATVCHAHVRAVHGPLQGEFQGVVLKGRSGVQNKKISPCNDHPVWLRGCGPFHVMGDRLCLSDNREERRRVVSQIGLLGECPLHCSP